MRKPTLLLLTGTLALAGCQTPYQYRDKQAHAACAAGNQQACADIPALDAALAADNAKIARDLALTGADLAVIGLGVAALAHGPPHPHGPPPPPPRP